MAPSRNGWSRSSARLSIRFAASASVRATMIPGDPHDVELEPGGVEPLDLLVRGHQHLAALMAALLGAGTLVLDVVPGHTRLDEASDQVAHMRITAVACVGVGDDERPIVVGRRRLALIFGHPLPQVLLVAVGGQQRAHQARGLLGHLAERVTREVGSRILADRTFRRRGPAAEVDALDAHPFHHHGLAGGGVGPERGDALAAREQLAKVRVELGRGRSGDGGGSPRGIVPPLLGHLPGGVEAGDPPRSGGDCRSSAGFRRHPARTASGGAGGQLR